MAKYIVEAQPCSIALREVEVKVVKVSQSGESALSTACHSRNATIASNEHYAIPPAEGIREVHAMIEPTLSLCRTALPLVGVEPRFWEDRFNNFSGGFQWTKWICTHSFWGYIPTYEGCLLKGFKHGFTHLEPQLRPQEAKPSCWLPRPTGGVSKSCFAMWAPQVIGKLSYECANMLDYNGSIYNQWMLNIFPIYIYILFWGRKDVAIRNPKVELMGGSACKCQRQSPKLELEDHPR